MLLSDSAMSQMVLLQNSLESLKLMDYFDYLNKNSNGYLFKD